MWGTFGNFGGILRVGGQCLACMLCIKLKQTDLPDAPVV